MRNRVIIEDVQPQLDCGRYFIKRILGERVDVQAAVFGDGHDAVRASLRYREEGKKKWKEVFMTPGINDLWTASFTPESVGFFEYQIEGWMDHLLTWRKGFLLKKEAGQHMGVELQIGANLLRRAADLYPRNKTAELLKAADRLEAENGYQEAVAEVLSPTFEALVEAFPLKEFATFSDPVLRVRVGRPQELFSTWYELFPRSASRTVGEPGTFRDVVELLPRLSRMGFDVLYLPPIHPIGKVNRKGRNNSVVAEAHDPGSPWAIGSDEGGHKDINPALGTMQDFEELIQIAREKYSMELAMDIAFQCAPDHPYIKEHPEWFLWRPDGTIAYAENPPKKYQDIVPLNFESDDWKNLWEELKSIFVFWIKKGVRIFRVDNPHTKPFAFWEWCINEVQKKYPDVIFLSEAFTRPKVMSNLAKLGFTQGYTYFTWRNSRWEMEEYLKELTQTEWREYFRPNFWPNTPDILAYELMGAGSNTFLLRYLLAATLSSNYGMYGPAYEFMENRGNTNNKEEYLDSEKYEVKYWDWNHRNRLTDAITRVNRIRRDNPAMHTTYNLHFTRTDNEQLMSYIKLTEDRSNIIWCIVNFDTTHTQSGFVEVPKGLLGIDGRMVNLKVHDLLTGEVYHWFNEWNYVELNPGKWPIHLFEVELK